MSEPSQHLLLKAALAYARRGLSTFPCAVREKAPLGSLVPNGYHDCSRDEVQLREWWEAVPEANVGLPCGPNGILAIDIDPRGGGADTWAALIEGREVPVTPEAVTGSDGRHLLFAAPEWKPKGAAGAGVDVKSAGYIVVAPSIHPCGGRYRWLDGRRPGDVPLAPIPDWLEEVIRARPPAAERNTATRSDFETAEEALGLLDCGRADAYESWIEVGMALRAVSDGLLGAWIDWSRQSQGFESQADCEKKWRSFSADGVGLGSLVAWAREDGTSEFLRPGWRHRNDPPAQRQHSANSEHPRDDGQAQDLLPPQNMAAERAVIGALLRVGEEVAEAVECLQPAAFYQLEHRIVFEACHHLLVLGKPVDLVTVETELRARGKLLEAGGVEALRDLAAATPSVANLAAHVQIVASMAQLRMMLVAARQWEGACQHEGADPVALLESLDTKLMTLRQGRQRSEAEPIMDIAIRCYGAAEERSRGGVSHAVLTGFRDLDQKTGGWKPGNLIIIGGRPGIGKTSLAVWLAMNAAMKYGKKTALFSLEMSKDELGDMMHCTLAGIDSMRWDEAQLSNEEWIAAADAGGSLGAAPIHVDDTGGLTVPELRSRCRRLAVRGLDLVVVDYIQLMAGEGENRQQQVSAISRGLKALAKELACPVIVCAALNRAVEGRGNKRPGLSDLRETGQIEADADLVMFVYRDSYYAADQTAPIAIPDPTEVIIAKQRRGPTGVVLLGFQPSITRFDSLTSAQKREYEQAHKAKGGADDRVPERSEHWSDR